MKSKHIVSLIALVCVVVLANCVSAQPIEEWCFIEFQGPSAQLVGVGGSGFGGQWDYYANTNWYNQWFYDHPLDYTKRKVITIDGMITSTSQFPVWVEIALNWSTDLYPPNPEKPPLPPLSPGREGDWIGRQVIFMEEVLPGETPFGIQDFILPVPYNPEWVSLDVRPVYAEDDGRIEIRALSFWHECIPAPPPPKQSANVGLGLATCPGATNPISSMTDSVGNKVETRCNSAFSFVFIRPGKGPCSIGACGFPVGENVGWVDTDSSGKFTQSTWHNYEGHVTPFDPASKVADSNGNGKEDRRTYIYDVASDTLTILNCVRDLIQTGPYKGCSNPGAPWVCSPAPGSPFSNYCGNLGLMELSPNPDEIDFISNTARVTPIQFVGAVRGGGQVVVSIHDVVVVVPTHEEMNVESLANQVVQHFNNQWSQPVFGQQKKSASISPHNGQVVYINNADEAEIQVRFVNEPNLGFNFFPFPLTPFRAFAFGSRLLDCPTFNDPTVNYTMVHHASPEAVQYDPGTGWGYEVIYPEGLLYGDRGGYGVFGPFDDSPNNRNKFSEDCPEHLYNSFIGAKDFTDECSEATIGDPYTPCAPTLIPEGIIFRVDVPDGLYRFVGAFGDADNVHAHRILAEDGGSGPPEEIGTNHVVLVSNFDQAQQTIGEADPDELGEGVYARVGFDGRIPPPGDGVFPSPQFVNMDQDGLATEGPASSPILRVTQGYIRIHQLQGNSNDGPGGPRDGNGGDMVILELWKVEPERIDPGTDGLVAHYAFENDTLDSSGNGLDGTVIGDPEFVDGVRGMALDFNGDDYVDCGTNDVLNNLNDSMTVSAWINIRSVTTTWMVMVNKGETAWRLGVNGDTTGIHYGFTGGDRGWQQANTATELVLGEWYHVVATYDTSVGAQVYLDGVVDASNPDPDGVATNEMPLLLGENPEAAGRFFDGVLDEVMIYGRALSVGEILYLTGFGRDIIENLVLNPSFEGDEDVLDDPDWYSWATWNPAEGAGSNAIIVDTEAIDGARSLLIEPIGPENWHFIVVNMPIPTRVGASYTASFWAKAAEPRPLGAQYKATDNTDSWGYTDFQLATDWAEYSFTADAMNVETKLEFFCAASEVPFWIDAVSVTEE